MDLAFPHLAGRLRAPPADVLRERMNPSPAMPPPKPGAALSVSRPLAALALATLSCWEPAAAHANGPPRKVLVLSVSDEGRQQEALRRALGSQVESSGAMLVSDAGLRDERRGCDEPRCLRSLAQDFGADLLLAARMERHGRFERLLDVWIYDVLAHRDVTGRALCDSRLPEPCVTELGGRLLRQRLGARSAEPTALATPPRAPSKTPAQPASSWPRWRIALGVGFGVAALTSLGIAIGYSLWHGQPTDGMCPSPGLSTACAVDGSPQLTAGYVLGGLASAAATATLAWPRSPRRNKETPR